MALRSVLVRNIPVAALALIGLTGCSHVKTLRRDIATTRAAVDSLRVEVREMSQRLSRQYELMRLVRADQQVRFDELERSIDAVSGNLTESQARLSSIDEKTQEIKKGWEEKARADSAGAAARSAEVETLFDIAMGDYLAGRRVIAISGFNDIVNRFPESSRGEDAAYWIGECHYGQKNYAEAESAFLDYLKRYPSGRKLCGAMFKLGLIYDVQKKVDSRDLLWNRLAELCPNSEEAQLAAGRLAKKR